MSKRSSCIRKYRHSRLSGIFFLLILPFPSIAVPVNSVENALSHRDKAIHWPPIFDPKRAFVFSHNEIVINSGCDHVWLQLIRADQWPEWLVLVKDVTLNGTATIQPGSVLTLKLSNSPIIARIDEFKPGTRLSWIPSSVPPNHYRHYHTWYLKSSADGCLVETEETGIGADDAKNAERISESMRRAHDLWLASLKWKSEQ